MTKLDQDFAKTIINGVQALILEVERLEAVGQDLEGQLHFCAGYISAFPQFSDKHPEDILDWIRRETKK